MLDEIIFGLSRRLMNLPVTRSRFTARIAREFATIARPLSRRPLFSENEHEGIPATRNRLLLNETLNVH